MESRREEDEIVDHDFPRDGTVDFHDDVTMEGKGANDSVQIREQSVHILSRCHGYPLMWKRLLMLADLRKRSIEGVFNVLRYISNRARSVPGGGDRRLVVPNLKNLRPAMVLAEKGQGRRNFSTVMPLLLELSLKTSNSVQDTHG